MTHTPAPWTASEGCPSDVWHVDMPGRSYSVIVSRSESDADMAVDEVQANARLIAAAPELLAQLRAVRDDIGALALDTNGWREWDATAVDELLGSRLVRLDDLIAKAEGRE
jgi:hypothetical protein